MLLGASNYFVPNDVSWEFSTLFTALKRRAVYVAFCFCSSTCIPEERWILGGAITKLYFL